MRSVSRLAATLTLLFGQIQTQHRDSTIPSECQVPMPTFRCFIRGEHFPGALAGVSAPIGFYTTRFVDAPSASDAEVTALNLLRQAPEFELVRPEDRTMNAKVYFDQIEEVLMEPDREQPQGFAFFPMDT